MKRVAFAAPTDLPLERQIELMLKADGLEHLAIFWQTVGLTTVSEIAFTEWSDIEKSMSSEFVVDLRTKAHLRKFHQNCVAEHQQTQKPVAVQTPMQASTEVDKAKHHTAEMQRLTKQLRDDVQTPQHAAEFARQLPGQQEHPLYMLLQKDAQFCALFDARRVPGLVQRVEVVAVPQDHRLRDRDFRACLSDPSLQ